MSKLLKAIAFAAVATASPAISGTPCSPRPEGPLPWAINEIMSGDRYADVYLDIDDKGKPTGCKMGKNNIPGDDKFFVCKAFVEQWSTKLPIQAGQAGPNTVKRTYFEYGTRHADAERAARKKFFREHPYERPECYPKED